MQDKTRRIKDGRGDEDSMAAEANTFYDICNREKLLWEAYATNTVI